MGQKSDRSLWNGSIGDNLRQKDGLNKYAEVDIITLNTYSFSKIALVHFYTVHVLVKTLFKLSKSFFDTVVVFYVCK